MTSQQRVDSPRKLMSETQQKIATLENAIQQVSAVKRHLTKNGNEVKLQIHSTISRHLEALRNREVWLLSQVDLILAAKEEVLQRQQARLNKTLGVMQSHLNFAEEEDGLSFKLAENLDLPDLSDLKPEETPYMTFKADPSLLRESIIGYGRVDANGLPLPSAFVEHGHPSTSLPRHFEEYDDAEHDVLYKTVEEINRTSTSDHCVFVNFPKLYMSPRPQDWLAGSTTTTTNTMSRPKFSFPPFSFQTEEWLQKSKDADTVTPSCEEVRDSTVTSDGKVEPKGALSLPRITSNASIQDWLQQIKQNPDVEDEEDFEIVENAGSTGSAEPIETLEMFQTLKRSGRLSPTIAQKWPNDQSQSSDVKTSSKDDQQGESAILDKWLLLTSDRKECAPLHSAGQKAAGGHQLDRYFQELPTESHIWLDGKLKEKTEYVSFKQMKTSAIPLPKMEMPAFTTLSPAECSDENACDAFQKLEMPIFTEVSRETTLGETNDNLLQEMEMPIFTQVYREVVPGENEDDICPKMEMPIITPVTMTVSPPAGSLQKMEMPVFTKICQIGDFTKCSSTPEFLHDDTTEGWLLRREAQDGLSGKGPLFQVFISKSDPTKWLASANNKAQPTTEIKCPLFDFFHDASDKTSKWLKAEQPEPNISSRNITSPDFKFDHCLSDVAKWLKKGANSSLCTSQSSSSSSWEKIRQQHNTMSLSDWLSTRSPDEMLGQEREDCIGAEDGFDDKKEVDDKKSYRRWLLHSDVEEVKEDQGKTVPHGPFATTARNMEDWLYKSVTEI